MMMWAHVILFLCACYTLISELWRYLMLRADVETLKLDNTELRSEIDKLKKRGGKR